ncbi:RRQRL motif-containing zinc-binding protein [Micromonospora sp. NBRC 110038]|uniref:RRQRL motif-containing zinc-binding protein n=1 Tax=Micromonospora sp. NBRC 110038 TaxID=1550034 RepID=UPI001E414801|nr:RRQRL motif-containing zinc-binding protein [Micromonospora sp. NBRC 110038]
MSRIRAAYWDPDGDRYGIPTFWWRGAPPGYATRRQLRAAGLRPAQPVAAQVLWRGVGGTRAAYLYRVDLARPKRTATPAQLRAVRAALTARRTCRVCGVTRSYYIPRSVGECLTCAAPATFPEEEAA